MSTLPVVILVRGKDVGLEYKHAYSYIRVKTMFIGTGCIFRHAFVERLFKNISNYTI